MSYTGLKLAVQQVLLYAGENDWDAYGEYALADIRDTILDQMVDQYAEGYQDHPGRYSRDRRRAKKTLSNQTLSFFSSIEKKLVEIKHSKGF